MCLDSTSNQTRVSIIFMVMLRDPQSHNCPKSDQQQLEFRIQIKELVALASTTLRLTRIQCMQSYNTILFEIRKKYKLDTYESKLKVIPYQKYKIQQEEIEEKIAKFKKLGIVQKRLATEADKEQMQGLYSKLIRDEKDTYQGFQSLPNNAYFDEAHPQLAPIYWQVISKYRIDMQKVADTLYHQSTKIVSQFSKSMVNFNQSMKETCRNTVKKLIQTPNDDIIQRTYNKITDQEYTPEETPPRTGILNNRFKTSENIVSFGENFIIQKYICEIAKQHSMPFSLSSQSFNQSDIWSGMIAKNCFSIEQLILRNPISHEQFKLNHNCQQQKSLEPLIEASAAPAPFISQKLFFSKPAPLLLQQQLIINQSQTSIFGSSDKLSVKYIKSQMQQQKTEVISQLIGKESVQVQPIEPEIVSINSTLVTAQVSFDQATGLPTFIDKIPKPQVERLKRQQKTLTQTVQEVEELDEEDPEDEKNSPSLHHISKNKKLLKDQEIQHIESPSIKQEDQQPKQIQPELKARYPMSFFTKVMDRIHKRKSYLLRSEFTIQSDPPPSMAEKTVKSPESNMTVKSSSRLPH